MDIAVTLAAIMLAGDGYLQITMARITENGLARMDAGRCGILSGMNQRARIEKWTFYRGCLIGVVYGHPKIKDGTEVVTSAVQTLDRRKKTATTRNTEYALGKEAHFDLGDERKE